MPAENPQQSSVGARLKAERKRLGYDQAGFAKVGGITSRTLIRYESDETTPPSDFMNKVGDAGVEVFWVLRGSREDDELREKASAPFPPRAVAVMEGFLSCPEEIKTAIEVIIKVGKRRNS